MGPSAASRGDNPLPEDAEVEEENVETEAKHAKPDYIDLDGDGDKEETMKKAAKDKEEKEKEKSKKEDASSDTETLIAELNKQYELMLIGGKL